MIPFARVLTYGNVVRNSKKVKQLTHDLDTLVLWEDGTLWGAGYNRYGQLVGNSSDTSVQKSYVQVTTGVDEIVSTWNSGFLIRKGGSYYCAGDIGFTGLSTSAGLYDCTSKIVLSGVTFKAIRCLSSIVFGVSTDNKLYGFTPFNTRGTLGDGTTNPSTEYKFLADGVDKIYCSGNNSFYISTGGQLYCTGWNQNSSLGINGSTQVNAWTLISQFVNVRDVGTAHNGTWVLNGDGRVYSVGSQANGTGSASTTYVQLPAIASANVGERCIIGTSSATFNTFCFMNTIKNGILFSGNMSYMGSGTNTDDKGLWSTNWLSGELVLEDVYGYFGYESNMWFDGRKILFCGQQRYIPGYPSTNASLQFKEVQLPPGTEF